MKCDEAILILENADNNCNEKVIAAETAVEEAFKAVDELKTAIVIPAGATNGDMIKAVFPTLSFNAILSKMYASCGQILLDWWNAPYKKGTNE